MQSVEHDFNGGRVHYFVDPRRENKGAGHAKAYPRKEPDREVTSGFHASLLPENDLQNDERDGHNNPPENRTVKDRNMLDLGNRSKAVHHILQLRIWFWFRQKADDDRHDHADQTTPESPKHVLRLVLRVHRESHIPYGVGVELDPRVHSYGRERSGGQAGPATRRRSALPEHAQENGPEERCDEETEQRLNVVHDARGAGREICRTDADHDAEDRPSATHPDLLVVSCVLVDQGPVDVIDPNSGESADIPRHAGHEACNEGGDA